MFRGGEVVVLMIFHPVLVPNPTLASARGGTEDMYRMQYRFQIHTMPCVRVVSCDYPNGEQQAGFLVQGLLTNLSM